MRDCVRDHSEIKRLASRIRGHIAKRAMLGLIEIYAMATSGRSWRTRATNALNSSSTWRGVSPSAMSLSPAYITITFG